VILREKTSLGLPLGTKFEAKKTLFRYIKPLNALLKPDWNRPRITNGPDSFAATFGDSFVPALNPHGCVAIKTAQTMLAGPDTERNLELMLDQNRNN
jgi:hypothetical protein